VENEGLWYLAYSILMVEKFNEPRRVKNQHISDKSDDQHEEFRCETRDIEELDLRPSVCKR